MFPEFIDFNVQYRMYNYTTIKNLWNKNAKVHKWIIKLNKHSYMHI